VATKSAEVYTLAAIFFSRNSFGGRGFKGIALFAKRVVDVLRNFCESVGMKTNELIAELKRLDPTGEKSIEVPVKTYTQAYPVAYLDPWNIEAFQNRVRIYVSFPEGYSVSNRNGRKSTGVSRGLL
jgi:hypothetical protein